VNINTSLLPLFVLCSVGCGGRGTDPTPAAPPENVADNEPASPQQAEAPDNPAIGPPQGQLTPYVCEDYIRVTHKDRLKDPDSAWRNVPGRGVVQGWKITRTKHGSYRFTGTVISNNTGSRKQGVPIYVGNPRRAEVLRLMALSDADGKFNFTRSRYRDARHEDVDKFLLVGDRFEYLIQYKIPYALAAAPDDAARDAAVVPH
jgi:hypothetical protein